ncbi:nuclear transport factor 2 family protein [Nostoc sp. CHAB 5715]|uniref:nuclear transport factor 2 family protein n=1 Tax=Nostoc sp. CHAB 5715 TaxID=2780400 RepID=UPI001E42C84D|nr:nuclear transport factor 2 family protein [Nostoc sp. CHAB 5715]MCC5623608.1 nuclear transport factor 2 family protein [Nostoc sp. CHAB 5715]
MDADWVRSYFKTVDTLDAEAIATHFTDDGKFRFSNQPPAIGRQAVRNALAQFFETIEEMHHESTGLWFGDDGNSAVWEADVTYTRKNGIQVTLPCVSILRSHNDQIYDFRMNMDISPVYADHEPE